MNKTRIKPAVLKSISLHISSCYVAFSDDACQSVARKFSIPDIETEITCLQLLICVLNKATSF